jgi:hypothetical protein
MRVGSRERPAPRKGVNNLKQERKMNKQRRKTINDLIHQMNDLRDQVEIVLNEEQEYFDNMPEFLKDGENGGTAENSIDNIQYGLDRLDEAIDSLESCL